MINYYELTRKHMSHVKKIRRFYIANKKVRLETLLLWTPFICEGTSYVFFPVTARLLTNVIIPVNLCSSAQLFFSILPQERERKVKVSHLIFHVFDYFVMLSIIYLPFDVVNDSFSVNLLSSVLFHPSTSTRERE